MTLGFGWQYAVLSAVDVVRDGKSGPSMVAWVAPYGHYSWPQRSQHKVRIHFSVVP